MSRQIIDPLLESFTLKNLRCATASSAPRTSRRIPRTACRRTATALYHVEKAKGGIGLTMMGGSAVVAPESPPRSATCTSTRTRSCPGCASWPTTCTSTAPAVMCQITHLGRRTSNYDGDWLPVLCPSPVREPAHRAFPKVAEDWDMDRIVRDYADATARCREAGLDGIELEAYTPSAGRLLVTADQPPRGRVRRQPRGPVALPAAGDPRGARGRRPGLHRRHPDVVRRGHARRPPPRGGADDRGSGRRRGRRLHQRDPGHGWPATRRCRAVIPPMGTPVAPHLEFAGEIKRAVAVPVMHASRINDVATARHAIRDGLLDLVGMTRAHIADPHIVAKISRAMRIGSGPASAPATASTRSTRPATPSASTTRRPGARTGCRTRVTRRPEARKRGGHRRRPRGAGGGPGARRARASRGRARGQRRRRRPDPARRVRRHAGGI